MPFLTPRFGLGIPYRSCSQLVSSSYVPALGYQLSKGFRRSDHTSTATHESVFILADYAQLYGEEEERQESVDSNFGVSLGPSITVKDEAVAKSWKFKLQSHEQLNYESDLGSLSFKGRRLVDYVHLYQNAVLWESLLTFRSRNHGIESIRPLWSVFRDRQVVFYHDSRAVRTVHRVLLQFGLKHLEILQEICDHAEFARSEGAVQWNQIYYKTIRHFLYDHLPEEVLLAWHTRLKHLPPTRDQLRLMWYEVINNIQARTRFLRLYQELPALSLYSTVIPALCKRKECTAALRAHNRFMHKGDVPERLEDVQLLLQFLALSDCQKELGKVEEQMKKIGIDATQSIKCTSRDPTQISSNGMSGIRGNIYDIAPKRISDEFCARLFATKTFSVETIIKWLQILGIQAIGPLALREIANRSMTAGDCQPTLILRQITLLEESDISIGDSVFSRLIRKLAEAANGPVLYDVVICDQHPEVMEDWKLQESLLARYHEIGDQRQVSRTLAILTLDARDELSTEVRKLNILLRSCLTRGDSKGRDLTVQTMLDRRIMLSKKSRRHMWDCLVSKRLPGRTPRRTDDLLYLINTWQNFMRYGTVIMPPEWIEIMRRFGMIGQFEIFENLAFWLARWYMDSAFKASQTTLTNKRGSVMSSLNQSERIDSQHHGTARHLAKLFSPTMQRAVLAWGFQRGFPKAPSDTSDQVLGAVQVSVSADHPSLWGLKLLSELRKIGIPFSTQLIRKFCKERLMMLSRCGRGFSGRVRNLRAQKHVEHRTGNFLYAMEQVWGPDLFMEDSTKRGNTIIMAQKVTKTVIRTRSRLGHAASKRFTRGHRHLAQQPPRPLQLDTLLQESIT